MFIAFAFLAFVIANKIIFMVIAVIEATLYALHKCQGHTTAGNQTRHQRANRQAADQAWAHAKAVAATRSKDAFAVNHYR